MQRQKSILSFFPKPSPATQASGVTKQKENGVVVSQTGTIPAVSDDGEIRGTDTPPEKVPRQILPWNEENRGSSLFSSIMHKFVRVDNHREMPPEREDSHGTPSSGCLTSNKFINSTGLFKEGKGAVVVEKENGLGSNGLSNQGDVLHLENDLDVPGPDTPGLRTLVPRLKRIQERTPESEDKNGRSLLDANKRAKFLQESSGLSMNLRDVSNSSTKFEWLEPSRIRDANRRKPCDPLYDKKTLYIPPEVFKKMSASQKQYWSVKSQYMDIVLFFKVGKFYELYELDAEIGHKELDWKMTLSGVGKCRQVGISESGIDDAVQKLVALGYKVGRVEQLETSDQAKSRGSNSVIPRKLVQVVTPATATDSSNIGHDAVHLLAIKEENHELDNGTNVYGFAFVDCAALRFWVGSIKCDASCASLGALLMQVSPKEVIYERRGLSREAQKALRKYTITGSGAVQLTPILPESDFVDASEVRNLIQSKGYFKGSSSTWNGTIDGIMQNEIAVCALGGLIGHLSRLMLDDVLQTGDILPYQVYRGCLRMDGQTLVNLELFSNNDNGGSSGTLFSYLDNCVTSSGKRLLRKWICHPLKCVERINDRLDVVEILMKNSEIMSVISQHLQKLQDLERMLGRIKASLHASESLTMPLIGKKILKHRVKVFGSLVKGLRVGVNLLLLLQEEQIISSLLKVFKLPKLNDNDGLDKFLVQFEAAVDSEFPNYQNHDVTEKQAETLSVLMELFVEKATEWSQVIHAFSCIDVFRSFAVTACMSTGAMSRPIILPESKSSAFSQDSREPVLDIKGLWHPFATGENGGFPVPNDLFLGKGPLVYHPRTLLLTGPNMGGKSTLLRATCLAVILAQLGCFVPSEKCVLSLVDAIFTRLGATDRIMTGESTFLVECTETASVLQNATQDSLVILDELGRGTSTFDGYAIAYAVFRHLVEKVNCRMLFATHYHPLTKEFASHPHVKLQHMACAFKSDSDLVFLYQLASGACPESYGMKVAAMAGIPEKVVDSAGKAGQMMKKSIGDSFKSSEQRSEFSSLHEEWLKSLVNFARLEGMNFDDDIDLYDTMFCLWHELKSSYR